MSYRSDTREYVGNGLPSGSWTVFKEAWMMASINSHIFKTSTLISAAGCCTRPVELHDATSSAMLSLPSDVVRSRLVQSVAECSSTSLLSHSSASQFIGIAVTVCNEDKTRDEFLDHLLHDENSRGTTDKSNIMNIALAVLLSRRHVQDPILVDVESYFNLRQATWCWREPNEMELPKRILVPSHRALPMKTWIRTPSWLSVYIENVCPFFVGKMVSQSMSFVMTTPAVSKPTDKGMTSKHESHCSRFFTGLPAFIAVQSTTFTGGYTTYS